MDAGSFTYTSLAACVPEEGAVSDGRLVGYDARVTFVWVPSGNKSGSVQGHEYFFDLRIEM